MCLHLPRIEARRATYSIAGPWYCPKCPGIGAIGEKRVEFSLPARTPSKLVRQLSVPSRFGGAACPTMHFCTLLRRLPLICQSNLIQTSLINQDLLALIAGAKAQQAA